MRVSCPKCQTEYEVPDAALTGRSRTLRCATCMTKWKVPALEMFRQSETEPAAPEPAAMEQEPAAPEAGPASSMEAADSAVLEETPPADEAMAEPGPADDAEILTARRNRPSAAPSSPRGLIISVLLVLLMIAAVLAEHSAIAHLWPPSLRLFNAIGLH